MAESSPIGSKTVRKRDSARYEQSLLSPQYLQRLVLQTRKIKAWSFTTLKNLKETFETIANILKFVSNRTV